jgi:hypothetical protein
MIDFRYLHYLMMKYIPLVISATAAAYFISYSLFDIEKDYDDLKFLCLCSLASVSAGWFTVFLAEERLRKLMLASHSLVQSINAIIEETKDEDRD